MITVVFIIIIICVCSCLMSLSRHTTQNPLYMQTYLTMKTIDSDIKKNTVIIANI